MLQWVKQYLGTRGGEGGREERERNNKVLYNGSFIVFLWEVLGIDQLTKPP